MGDSSRLRRSAALQRLAIRPSGGVAALLVAYLVLACAYGVVTPVFEAADEHTHYFYAQYVGRARRLPVQSTGNGQPSGPWEQEGSQPPLYYLLVAPLVAVSGSDITSEDLLYNHQNTMGHPALVGNENRFVHPADREGWPWQGYSLGVHLARSVSTLLGLIAVLASLALARAVFVERPWLAVVSAAVVALSPQFLHVTSSVSNDPAIAALAALALWLTIRVVDGHDEAPSVVALAVVTGLAPLAKLSGAMLALFVLGSLAAVAWRRRDRAFLLRTALPVALALVVLSGWWYARNLRLYGSLTGLEAMLGQQLSREMRPASYGVSGYRTGGSLAGSQ
jgi:4-amino-4-deoxy-L-arabinose transferase-like glycosyltransferase